MTEPLVSILICNYNYAEYLREAIDSALNQTYSRVEVVLVDDGSTDGSIEIGRSYGSRIVFISQPNRGFLSAFATAFALSSGDIICPLDSDDRSYPDRVARVVATFMASPNAVQVTHHRRTIASDGTPLLSRSVRLSSGDVRGKLFRWGRYVWGVTSQTAYRRDALAKLLPVEKRRGENGIDTYLTIGAAFLGDVVELPECLTDYRTHADSMQGGYGPDQLVDQRLATIEIINAYAEHAGDSRRATPLCDNELTALTALTDTPAPRLRRLAALARTIAESFDLRRSLIDAILTLLTRTIVSFVPSQGARIIALGPARYFKAVITRWK